MKLLSLLAFLGFGTAFAVDIRIDNITNVQLDSVIKEFSANQYFYPVSPASSLGKKFGVEFGLVAGVTRTPDINKITHDISPTAKDLKLLPHGTILGRIGVPWGIGLDIGYLPKISASGVDYKQFGGALRWTITDVFFTELPLSLQARLIYAKTDVSFATTLSNASTGSITVPISAALEDKMSGAQLVGSKEFFGFLEPYLGLGMAKAKGTLSVSGSSTAYNISASLGASASSNSSSFHYFAGFNMQGWIFVLGADYNHLFGTDVYNAKLSFRF